MSKIIIPIALAISLVFAGFTVYANEAENFVVRTNKDKEIKLSLATQRKRDKDGECELDENGKFIFLDKTSILNLPASGEYINITYTPDADLKYDANNFNKDYVMNIPNDITYYDGIHSGYNYLEQVTFYSFSFFLINDSDRPVDVDMYYRFNSRTYSPFSAEQDHHVDDAIKIMYVEGEQPLWNKKLDNMGFIDRDVNGKDILTPGNFLVYSKPEKEGKAGENWSYLTDHIDYEDKIIDFYSDTSIFERTVSNGGGFSGMAPGDYIKFTFVLWLEGWDVDCDNTILGEKMKMSIDFIGS